MGEFIDGIFGWLSNFFDGVAAFFSTIDNPVVSVLDILVVAFIIYNAFKFIRQTRAEQLIKGITILIAGYFIAFIFNMSAVLWLVSKTFEYGIIVLVVLFQPELRSVLERVGRGKFANVGSGLTVEGIETLSAAIDELCKACQRLQREKTGALIVIEKTTMLGEVCDTGTEIDSKLSEGLISSIFFQNSPLHDGAVIIRENRIVSAGCILPLSQNNNIDVTLGTRHRAAIGVSEISDAVAIVISEETGIISVVNNGVIERDFNIITLREKLTKTLMGEYTDREQKKGFRSRFPFMKGGNSNEKK